MNEMIPAYAGGESTLYAITDMACQSCTNNMDAFTKFNNQYNSDFVQGILDAMADAEALPNSDQRLAVQTGLRKTVAKNNNSLCVGVLSLMQYIGTSFLPDQAENMKKLAGSAYYKDASNENWQATSTLLNMANTFIGNNMDILAKGGMPEGFTKDFDVNGRSFTDSLKAYNDYRNSTENVRATKVAANNGVYARLQQMMKDGRHIFRKDAALKKQFSYAALAKKIGRHGKTGCRFVLQTAGSLLPVTTATIGLQPGNYTITGNEKGVYKDNMPAGIYSFVITAPGFAPVDGSLTVTTGVTRHEKFVLLPAVVQTATA